MERREEQIPRQISDAQYSCSPPKDQCPAYPQAVISSFWPAPPSSHTGHDVLWFGIWFCLVWITFPVHVTLPSFLCTCTLAVHGKPKLHCFTVSTTEQQLKPQSVINTILLLNRKQSSVSAVRKKINSIPAETRPGTKAGKHESEIWRTICNQVLFQGLLLCKLSLASIKPQLMTDTLGRLGKA